MTQKDFSLNMQKIRIGYREPKQFEIDSTIKNKLVKRHGEEILSVINDIESISDPLDMMKAQLLLQSFLNKKITRTKFIDDIDSLTVPGPRKLKAKWTLEAAQDLTAMIDKDIQDDLVKTLQKEIEDQVIRKIIPNGSKTNRKKDK